MRATIFNMIRETLGMIAKHTTAYSGNSPTTQELLAENKTTKRIFLVIKFRWIIIALLAGYGIFTGIIYLAQNQKGVIEENFLIPGIILMAVAGYNSWYHISYRWFRRVKGLNQLQIIFDLLVITAIIHYSGGVLSWFCMMYLVLTLEAVFLFDRNIETWAVGILGGLLYGALITLEYYSIIPPVEMPFENLALQHNFAYEITIWLWVAIMNGCIALIGTYLMDMMRKKEKRLEELVIKDELTNLYNRRYFFQMLSSEIERCRRYNRGLSLLMLDLDNFKEFNDAFGHQAGDELLKSVANVFRQNIRRKETNTAYDIDIPCRYGGEEFAIILPETPSYNSVKTAEKLKEEVHSRGSLILAERIRKQVSKSKFGGKGITISIGVAIFPIHGRDSNTLIKSADDALYEAKDSGKNTVVLYYPGEKNIANKKI